MLGQVVHCYVANCAAPTRGRVSQVKSTAQSVTEEQLKPAAKKVADTAEDAAGQFRSRAEDVAEQVDQQGEGQQTKCCNTSPWSHRWVVSWVPAATGEATVSLRKSDQVYAPSCAALACWTAVPGCRCSLILYARSQLGLWSPVDVPHSCACVRTQAGQWQRRSARSS
jgi:hypothetical protein